MNRSILIFTDNFPFGKSESFLETELQFIDNSFEKISLFPFEKGKDSMMRELHGKTEIAEPVFNEVKNKTELLTKGLFNTSPFYKLLKEGIRSSVWKSGRKFRIWSTHFLVVRSLLGIIKQRDLINFFNRFDVLYFYWGLRWSQILPFLPADIQAKIVVRFHGSDLYEYTNHNYIPWRQEQLSGITKAVAISETGKKYIENEYPLLRDRVIVSRIGTIDSGINPFVKSDTTRIVSCSNLVPVKRVRLIVEVLSFLKIQVNWLHFGDGPGMTAVEILSKKLPDNISCEIRGSIGHNELMDYYRSTSIDLFINVSSSEGVPVSLMEVMSFGIPVVATNVGGTHEIVSGKNGLLVDADFSPEELASKIEELIKADNYLSLRAASREEWEKKCMAENVYPAFINQLLNV
jgi:colanic acid/amylovoran biosynthesis glycosyltransferase